MMPRLTPRLVRILAAALLLAVVALGGRAWACVPQPLVSLQPMGSGPAGSEVTVNAIAVNGAAEIRWNGSDGALLSTVAGPAISSKVKVPAVEPGLYTIIVVERTKTGSLGSSGRAAFLVTPGGTPAAAIPPARVEPPGEDPASSGGDGVRPVLAVAGGVILLAVGGMGGAILSARRVRTHPGEIEAG